jgi:hypothetical protein
MTLKKPENSEKRKRKHLIARRSELVIEEIMDLTDDRIRDDETLWQYHILRNGYVMGVHSSPWH